MNCHFQPKIESDDAFVDVFEVVLESFVDWNEDVVIPDHHRAVISVLVVLLAGQVAGSQCHEFSLVLEHFVQVSCNYHVQVDVELPALDAVVLE